MFFQQRPLQFEEIKMKENNFNRRVFLKSIAASTAAVPLALSGCSRETKTASACPDMKGKRHIVTLSFDDGFKKSTIKTIELYEKYGLSASINVVATAHRPTFVLPNEYHKHPAGDFKLWNELKQRGHEVMPHGYKHTNKSQIPFTQAKQLILACLDVFDKELKGFDRKQSIFVFPHNASTPKLEQWLPSQVRAFRTSGGGLNPLPYKGQVKLTCSGFGPGNSEAHLDNEVKNLLAQDSGWLNYNLHGLDDEGWGPIRASYLDELLDRLMKIESVAILPHIQALNTASNKKLTLN
jgi:peptidoglycan/xylan/chitin deacetylase (PgdA/CDA1 family)